MKFDHMNGDHEPEPVESLTHAYSWAAGFIDGEGCFSLGKSKAAYGHPTTKVPSLHVGQKRRAPLDRLAELFGGNVLVVEKWRPGYSGFQWTITGARLVDVIPHLLPYLCLKHREAELVLAYARTVNAGSRGRGRGFIPESERDERAEIISAFSIEKEKR